MLGVRAVGSAQGKFQPLGPGVCRERGLSSKNLTRQGLRGTGYGARPQILVFSPHFGGRRWAVPAGTPTEISWMDFWVPKGNLGMGEEGHSQHGDVRTGGEDRAPPHLWVLQVPQKQPGRAAAPHPVPVGLIPSVQLCRVDSQLPAPRRAALRHQPGPEQAGEERNESKGN